MGREERQKLGTSRVGEPIGRVVKAFVPAIIKDEIGACVDPRAVMQYINAYLLGAFVSIIDKSTENLVDLEAVRPKGVEQAVILLLRDLLVRQLLERGLPLEEACRGADGFVAKVVVELEVDPAPIIGPKLPLDTSDLEADWAADVMEAVGLSRRHGMMLVISHAAFLDP